MPPSCPTKHPHRENSLPLVWACSKKTKNHCASEPWLASFAFLRHGCAPNPKRDVFHTYARDALSCLILMR